MSARRLRLPALARGRNHQRQCCLGLGFARRGGERLGQRWSPPRGVSWMPFTCPATAPWQRPDAGANLAGQSGLLVESLVFIVRLPCSIAVASFKAVLPPSAL